MSTTDHEERRTRPFADFLAEHNNGLGARQAAEALQRVVGAVLDTGKKGSVTLTVNVEPMKNNADALVTTIVVGEKVPATPPRGAVFYADGEHNLTRTDPAQLAFEGLREVEAPKVREGVRDAASGGDAR